MTWVKTTVGGDVHYFNDGADTGAPLLIVVTDQPSDPQRRIAYYIPYVEAVIPEPTTAEIEAYFDGLYGT